MQVLGRGYAGVAPNEVSLYFGLIKMRLGKKLKVVSASANQ
jgi:hypothetical protein